MTIGILTSSRADFGIYTPLIIELSSELIFKTEIIAFGMHLQKDQGETLSLIKESNYGLEIKILETKFFADDIQAISYSYGSVIKEFSMFWKENKYDFIFALGDRWEMSAAVQSSIPFEIPIGHIHGGETTFGAIDNIYRHQISLASKLHFTSCYEHSKKVKELTGLYDHIYNVGSLNLQDIHTLKLPSWDLVKKKFDIPFDEFILVTFHPESIRSSKNLNHLKELELVLQNLLKTHNLLITNANSDAYGSYYNELFRKLQEIDKSKIKLVSALGRLNYFTTMSRCEFLLGNSSSALIESASFKKWALNIGSRQDGRIRNKNVIDAAFDHANILEGIRKINNLGLYNDGNIFFNSRSSVLIKEALKEYFKL